MSDKLDEKLESMLSSRRMEAASPDLAQRIILQARQTPQIESFSLAQWMRGLFSEFHLPKPAYVLAGALVMGIVVGLNAPVETDRTDDIAPVTIQSFFYTDEAML